MKIESYTYPKSSFLSVDKDMSLIVDYILKNNRLKKLLHYTTKDCLAKRNLTEEESVALFGKNVKIIPKLTIDSSVLNYVNISFLNFSPNDTNPEFRDNIIEFDIICHYDQWLLQDFQMRPYKIAAELDSMLDGQKLTGIGELEFIGGNRLLINNEFGGLCLFYSAIHGGEDKVNAPKKEDNMDLIENFNEIFNNG